MRIGEDSDEYENFALSDVSSSSDDSEFAISPKGIIIAIEAFRTIQAD